MMAILGIGFLLIAWAVFSTIWGGYVLCILWGWFIVPTFHLTALSVPSAIGVAMIASYLTYHWDGEGDGEQSDRLFNQVAWGICKPAIALFVGWIVKQYL